MATKDDLAALIKSGISAGMLTVALLNRAPTMKNATPEFIQAVADQLKSENASAKAGIEELEQLAKTGKPTTVAPADPKAALEQTRKKVDADAAATTKTAPQRDRDQQTVAEGQKHLVKASKGLGFEVAEQPAKSAAPEAAAAPDAKAAPEAAEASAPVATPATIGAQGIETTVQAIRAGLQQMDDVLQSMPPEAKRQAADKLNGFGIMPQAAAPYAQQANAIFAALGQSINALSTDDQREIFSRFGIDMDSANAAQKNGGAAQGGGKKPQLNLGSSGNSMSNMMGTKGNPAIGSRIDPLDQTPILNTNQNGQNGMSAPDTRSKPPLDQLRQIIVDRLGIAGGRYNYRDPTELTPINWDNPQENPDMARFHASIGPRGAPQQRQLPPLQPMPGGLEKLVASFGSAIGEGQMLQLLAAAKQNGVSADTIADQIISKQGPFAQLAPRLGYGMNALISALDQKDPKWGQRAQALQSVVSAVAATPPGGASSANLMSGAEMTDMLKRSGSPTALAQQILSGQHPMQGRLTGEAVGMLQAALDPSLPKTQAEAEQFVALSDGLRQLQSRLPPGPASLISGAPYGMQGYVPFNGTSPMTGALATMGAGFIPTGNTGFDLANSIAMMPTYSPTEQALLNQIQDPQQRAMQELQMFMQKQALLATTLSNLANMRHEMLKTVANNLRG
jgi:hypothetical protein